MDLSKDWIRQNIHLIEPHDVHIPKRLHLIWVGEKEVPKDVLQNVDQWKHFMPEWTIRLWKNEDIHIHEFPNDVIEKIHAATKPAQKADIMRYFIVEKYGGFYVDTDIVPYRSLTPLTQMGFDLVLYHDNQLTWEYIINCAFGAIPHHPVLQKACEIVRSATLNTSDVHMKTGPYVWGTAVASTPALNKKYALLSSRFFDQYDYFETKYGKHTYAASWVSP